MDAAKVWSLIMSGAALLCAIAAFVRNTKSDSAANEKWQGEVYAKLDHIAMRLRETGDISKRVAELERKIDDALKMILKEGDDR